jgi:hypothetical protein
VEGKEMKLRRVVVGCATVSLLWCVAAREAAAQYSENFDSYTNGTPMTSVSGWQAPVGGSGNGQFNVWADSEIDADNTNTPPINYGPAGYNLTQGMETKFASGGNATLQTGALDTMTGANIINTSSTSPFFSTQIRLSSYQINGPGNTNVNQAVNNTDNGVANSFMLYLGTGIQYGSGATAGKMILTNAQAFVVYFESGKDVAGGTNTIWTEGQGSATPSYTPGFSATAGGATSFDYRNNINNQWSRDTWYTVQLSSISLGGSTTNNTAVLNIFASDNPSDLIVSNLIITAQGGSSNAWGNTMSQINQIGFAETRQNGVDDIDNIVLIPEPGTVMLTVSGLFGMALVMRRRRRYPQQ